METRLLSVVIPETLYKQIKNYCVEKDIKIKAFIAASLITTLDQVGRYGKKSVK